MPKSNAELFALTYGSLVSELLRDYENDIPQINTQLERIGHSIGMRCVDELLAKSELNEITISPCKKMKDTAEVVAKIGFRMFLGMSCEVANISPDGKAFSLFLYENPLSIFVELPDGGSSNGEEGGPDWSKMKNHCIRSLMVSVLKAGKEVSFVTVRFFFSSL